MTLAEGRRSEAGLVKDRRAAKSLARSLAMKGWTFAKSYDGYDASLQGQLMAVGAWCMESALRAAAWISRGYDAP